MDNPIPGFVNLYSALGQEEDRSEIFALMMSDIERPILTKICKEDPVVRAKVKVMAKKTSKSIRKGSKRKINK